MQSRKDSVALCTVRSMGGLRLLSVTLELDLRASVCVWQKRGDSSEPDVCLSAAVQRKERVCIGKEEHQRPICAQYSSTTAVQQRRHSLGATFNVSLWRYFARETAAPSWIATEESAPFCTLLAQLQYNYCWWREMLPALLARITEGWLPLWCTFSG